MADQETKVHSLYGFPVVHSLSPVIFNKTFQQLRLNRTYVPFPVKPEDLAGAVEAARTLGFEGFNVTMPHKTAIVPLLDSLEGAAERIGSVNTVAGMRNGLVGYNTDGEGAIRAIRAHGFEPKGRKVLVIGAGGASRALVHSISHEAGEILVLNKTPLKARQVAELANGTARVAHGELTRAGLEEALGNTELIVNATPVQTPNLLEDLNLPPQALRPSTWLFDLAYDKPPAPLAVKVHRISPLEMLVQQAALSYEIWLGKPAPLEVMRSILVQHNGGDWK